MGHYLWVERLHPFLCSISFLKITVHGVRNEKHFARVGRSRRILRRGWTRSGTKLPKAEYGHPVFDVLALIFCVRGLLFHHRLHELRSLAEGVVAALELDNYRTSTP